MGQKYHIFYLSWFSILVAIITAYTMTSIFQYSASDHMLHFFSNLVKTHFSHPWRGHFTCLNTLLKTRHLKISNGTFISTFGAHKGCQKLPPRWCCIFTWRRQKYNMFIHHFQMAILNSWKIIFKKWRRLLFLTHQIMITSLIFPTSVTYWENQIHNRVLFFRFHMFPILTHVFRMQILRKWKQISGNWERLLFIKN